MLWLTIAGMLLNTPLEVITCAKKTKTMSLSAELRSGSRKKLKASSYSAMYYCT